MYEDVDGVCGALGDFIRARFIPPCPQPRDSNPNIRRDRVRSPSTGTGKKLQRPVDVGNMRNR